MMEVVSAVPQQDMGLLQSHSPSNSSSAQSSPTTVSPATVTTKGTPESSLKSVIDESETPGASEEETWKGEKWTPAEVCTLPSP